MLSPLYLCLHLRDFAAQALTAPNQPTGGPHMPSFGMCGDAATAPLSAPFELTGAAAAPLAVLSGDPPLERVFALNQPARLLGLQLGMSRVQAESFLTAVLRRNRVQEDLAFSELMACAQQLSPRIEIIASPQPETCGATLILDVSGSERLLGTPRQIATTLHRSIAQAGYDSSVAAGHNAYTALLAARGLPGITTLPADRAAQTLAPLPLSVLELNNAQSETFSTWGIETLGELAALPTKSLIARIGQSAFHLQALARGECDHLLVPTEEPADAALSEHMELDHPVELLEPLLFLLSHMLEQITQRAAQRSLAIASVETCLVLESSNPDSSGAPSLPSFGRSGSAASATTTTTELRRTIRPALPERNPLTLLKLIQLDLELHPPAAAVIALHLQAHPARPQITQQGLFAAQAPEAGRLEILLARLRKLVGEDRVGAPELLDTHAPAAFRVTDFEITESTHRPAHSAAQSATQFTPQACAIRMVRPPRAISIELREDTPSAMYYESQRLLIHTSSGPWRTNGAWWTHPAWCREEWDVVLQAEPQRCLRLAHDPAASCWYVIGIYD